MGSTVAEAARRTDVTDQTLYSWRSDCGGLRVDQAARLKRLELKNRRLQRAADDRGVPSVLPEEEECNVY